MCKKDDDYDDDDDDDERDTSDIKLWFSSVFSILSVYNSSFLSSSVSS